MLNQAYSQNHLRGFSLIGLAVDKPESVQAFLGKLPLEFPIALAAQDGAALARSLGNMVGALPFSVLLDSAGRSGVGKPEEGEWLELPEHEERTQSEKAEEPSAE